MAEYRVPYSGGLQNGFLVDTVSLYCGDKKNSNHTMCSESKEISWKEKLNAILLNSKHINARIPWFSSYNILKGTMSAQRYKLNLGFKQHYFVVIW